MITDTYARTALSRGAEKEGITYARTAPERDKDIYGFTSKLISWGRKVETAEGYAMVLRMLTRILEENGLETDPRRISEDDLYRLFDIIDRAPSTKERYKSTMLFYCRYYGNDVRIRLLLNDESPNVKWITDEDVRRCFEACRNDKERLMIHLGADYGLRREEIANLCIEDIDWSTLSMTVYGKGHGD